MNITGGLPAAEFIAAALGIGFLAVWLTGGFRGGHRSRRAHRWAGIICLVWGGLGLLWLYSVGGL